MAAVRSGQWDLPQPRTLQDCVNRCSPPAIVFVVTGLTEVEKEEGEAAKKALAEEAGERPEDAEGSDDENYKKNNQFGEHMKRKNEAVRTQGCPCSCL